MTSKDGPAIEADNIAVSIRRHAEAVGGYNFWLPPRDPVQEPPDFSWTDDDENIAEIRLARFARQFRGNAAPDDSSK